MIFLRNRLIEKKFDCATLSHSLSWVPKSLKQFVISSHFISLQTDVVFESFSGMNSRLDTLQDFQKLSSLEMPNVVLFGWNAGF